MLPENAKESNLRKSLIKYFKDGLPDIKVRQGESRIYGEKTLTKWVSLAIGSQGLKTVTGLLLSIYVCTRKDSNGSELSKLRDEVVGLISTEGGKRHIPFYSVSGDDVFTLIGGLVVIGEIIISPELESLDGTRYKMITLTLKWVSNV